MYINNTTLIVNLSPNINHIQLNYSCIGTFCIKDDYDYNVKRNLNSGEMGGTRKPMSESSQKASKEPLSNKG